MKAITSEMPAHDEVLRAIIATALDNSISHWADISDVLWHRCDMCGNRWATFKVREKGCELEGGWKEVDSDLVCSGLEEALRPEAKTPKHIKTILTIALVNKDTSEISVEVADCVMQFAVLGELLYG